MSRDCCLLAQYLDEYRFGHRNFVAVFIRIRAIDRLLRRYGEEACNELLGCIADEIRRIVGPVGASGRFDRNQFLVFSQYTSQEEVRDLGQRLRTGIEAIHSCSSRCTWPIRRTSRTSTRTSSPHCWTAGKRNHETGKGRVAARAAALFDICVHKLYTIS